MPVYEAASMRLLQGFAKRFSTTTLKSLNERGTGAEEIEVEATVLACTSPTIASSKMTSLKERKVEWISGALHAIGNF